MATLPTLGAGDVDTTNSDHEGQTSATAPLQEIGSANDTSYIFEGNNQSFTSTAYLALEDVPADFGTMDTLSVQYRRWADQVTNNKTLDSITVQIFQSDLSTALTNAQTTNLIGGLSDTTPTNSGTFSMSGLDTTAPKSVWDGAVVAISFSVTRSMGGNQDEYRISAFELTGTYTQRTASAPTSRTLSAAAAGSQKVNLSWNAEDIDTGAYPLPTYTIQKSTDGTNFTNHATGVTSQDSYQVTGLTNNQLYYLKITGTNASGSAVSNTVTITPAAFVRENTLEGGTDEAAISTNASQSGPDAFDYFVNDTAVVYDTARASHGTVSMRSERLTNQIGASQAGWDVSSLPLKTLFVRFYLYFPAPATGEFHVIFKIERPDGAALAYLMINSTGTVSIFTKSGSGGSLGGNPTSGSLTPNQWTRIEAMFNIYVDGSEPLSEVRIYDSPNSTTATSTRTISRIYELDSFGNVLFGIRQQYSSSYGPLWIDSVKVSDEDWIGPVSTASTSFQGKLGDLTVSKMYLGDTEVTGGYLGDINLWS